MHIELKQLADMGYAMLRDFDSRALVARTPVSIFSGHEFRGVNRLILLGLNKDVQHEYFDQNEAQEKGIIPQESKSALHIYERKTASDLLALPVWPLAFASNQADFEHFRIYGDHRSKSTTEAIVRSFFQNTGHIPVTIDVGSHLGQGPSPRIHLGKEIEESNFDCVFATVFSGLIHWARHHPGIIQHYPQGHAVVSENRAYENLVAEIGAAFLSAMFFIRYEPAFHDWNSHWIEMVQNDPQVLEAAATEAQIAVDFLENLAYDRLAEEAEWHNQ